jgi:hypothetical protein
MTPASKVSPTGSVSDATDAEAKLHEAIGNGSFTPFLGAGASTFCDPTPGGDPRWATFDQRVQALLQLNRTYESFLGSLLDGHCRTVPRLKRSNPDEISAFQVAVIDLIGHLTDLVAKQMRDGKFALVDAASYEVPILDTHRDRLATLVVGCVDAAAELPTVEDDEPDHLDKEGIQRSLTVLACQLLDDRSWKLPLVARARAGHEIEWNRQRKLAAEQARRTGGSHGSHVRLERIEWLTDLVWHTLSFDVPVYPGADDLAFRISLRASVDSLLARGHLPEKADAYFADQQLPGRVASWMHLCERDSTPSSSFHRAVAAALSWGHHLLVKNGRNHAQVPMAFTTNYDRSLEIALYRMGIDFHVICPVIPIGGSEPCWLMRTISPPPNRRNPKIAGMDQEPHNWGRITDPLPGDKSGQLIVGGTKMGDPIGPIVVKLHGSPLEPIETAVYQHFLILSESSYLQTIAGRSNPPAWVEAQVMQPQRGLWFFGYSLSDWSVRLSLYGQVIKPTKTQRSAVTSGMTFSQKRLFKPLVSIYPGDIADGAAMIASHEEVARRMNPLGGN